MRLAVLLIVLACWAAATRADEAACARRHRVEHDIHWNGGVYTEQAVVAIPMTVTIPAGVDAAGYASCLEQEGVARDGAVAAYVERLAACGRESGAARTVSPGRGDGHKRIGAPEPAALRACLEGRIEVEATLPAAVK